MSKTDRAFKPPEGNCPKCGGLWQTEREEATVIYCDDCGDLREEAQ